MAVPSLKRAFDNNNELKNCKRSKNEEDEGSKLNDFLTWCSAEGLTLSSKVRVGKDGSCAQYGMIAVSDIDEGEVLFEIPRSMLLHPETCSIASLLEKEHSEIESPSGWVPLLLALMFEFTNATSRWRHYVHLVPDFDALDLPMFWSSHELKEELRGTGVDEAVVRDLTSLTKEFNEIVLPFVKKHSSIFKPICHDVEFYKKMVAFVMAYSFTDQHNVKNEEDNEEEEYEAGEEPSSPPMMVPMADILNHVSKNNAQMFFDKHSLIMTAKVAIKKDEEVYNTYGCNANGSLLQMYGFAEDYPQNLYDTVEFPASRIMDIFKEDEITDLLDRKWKFLDEQDIVSPNDMFVLGSEGFLTEEQMCQMLKVLAMTEQEFTEYIENEGWEEESENGEGEESESLTFDKFKKLPEFWKNILQRLAQILLSGYRMSVEQEETHREALKSRASTSPRHLFSSHVRYGQMKLITRLLDSCSSCTTTLTAA